MNNGFVICAHVVVNLFCMAGIMHWQLGQEDPMPPISTACFMSMGVIGYWTFKYFLRND